MVVLAVVEVSAILVKIKIEGEVRGNVRGNVRGKVNGGGRECPSYTSCVSGARKPDLAQWWKSLARFVTLSAGMGSFDCA
jgi:hypothetical protein